ncbi:hypothetical protein QJS04_geneDACA006466 [Acorus gramineus]|uniref:DNA polymerase V n=1 Tax=Acorus gramineus TaxID=55184 RepID=A0AAV9AX28_ACOGR|nr:hypothetical protein QJS04_geneDACA006466 [Acorus gramineus]
MGSKKRPFKEETDANGEDNNSTEEPMTERVAEDETPAIKPKKDRNPETSLKPMERKKQRKALAKEKHRVATADTEPARPVPVPAPSAVAESSGDLPEFHIGVFKDLSATVSSIREAAVEAMTTELRRVQEAYERIGEEGRKGGDVARLEAEKDDGLDNCAPSCARQGFALGLSAVVGTIPSIKLDSMMKLIVNLLEITSSMKGQEAKDCLLGRLFAYGALARSRRITKPVVADKNTLYVKEFVGHVLSLAEKKRYLREPAISIILDVVEQMPVEALMNQVLEAPGMQQLFEKAVEIGDPDALFLALEIQEKFPTGGQMFHKLLPHPFNANLLFSRDHLSTLISCFKESSFCQPRVHSLWPVLINILLPKGTPQSEDATLCLNSKKHRKIKKCNVEDVSKNIQNFCEVVIEESLLMSSHDRKHLAFDILLLLLPRLPASCIQIVLSHKLVYCLMDILSTKESWLYKAAQHFLRELSNWVGDDVHRRVAVIIALQKHSNGRFDCITRMQAVKELVAKFNSEQGCMLLVHNLMSMFVDNGSLSDEPSDQSQTTDENSEAGSVEDKDSSGTPGSADFLKNWIIETMPRILKNLKVESEAKFRVQTEIQLLLANAQKEEGSASLSNVLDRNDLGSYFMRFLDTLHNIPSLSLYRHLSNDDEKVFKELQLMETQLSSELLLQVLLRPGEFSEAASELVTCCKKAFPAACHDESMEEDDQSDDDDAPNWMDVLIDTLLSLLPQSSSPISSAVEQVFRFFCDDITDSGLHRMLRIVKKDLNPGRRRGMEQDSDEDDDDFLGLEEAEDGEEAQSEETGESGDHADDSDDMMETNETGEDNRDAKDPSVSDDSDEEMDDEAMFRKPQVLTVYTYLYRAFVNSYASEGGEQLRQRVSGILQKKILKSKEYPRGDEIQLSTLQPLLEKSLEAASRSNQKPIISLAESSMFWLLKIIHARCFSESELEGVFKLFKDVLTDYCDNKKSRVKPAIVRDVFQRHPWISHHLFGLLLEKCGGAVSEFRRVELLNILSCIFKSWSSKKGDGDKDASSRSKMLKQHLPALCELFQKVLTNEDHLKRAELRRHCAKVLQVIVALNLKKSFLKALTPDAYAACESHLGQNFLPFKKSPG